MPHADREHELQISLATALRELDEARTDAANLRFVNDKARESLAAANAKADAAEVELRVSGAAYGSLQDALATARRECEGLRNDIAAWMLDRADQYDTDDPIWVGIADLAKGVVRGDAQEAAKHGELEADLYSRLGIVRAALAGPAPAPGEETKR